MSIEVLVQNPRDLKKITKNDFDFTQVGYFQVEVEDGELKILDIPYFETGLENSNIKLIFISVEGDLVVGALVLEYCEKGWNFGPNKWSMMSIGVNKDFRGKGHSKLMIEAMFSTMNELGLSGLAQSSYTEDGNKCVKKIFNHYSKVYPTVNFCDTDKIF